MGPKSLRYWRVCCAALSLTWLQQYGKLLRRLRPLAARRSVKLGSVFRRRCRCRRSWGRRHDWSIYLEHLELHHPKRLCGHGACLYHWAIREVVLFFTVFVGRSQTSKIFLSIVFITLTLLTIRHAECGRPIHLKAMHSFNTTQCDYSTAWNYWCILASVFTRSLT